MGGLYHNKALPKGSVLREWRLEEVLGVGGFGIVYRGRSLYFDEQVAIKEYFPGAISDRVDDTTVAPTDSSAEETYALGLSKFLEEAKVLWNLSRPERHPNIVSVRSLFEIHGTAYMVMDFEKGVSLSQMIKARRKFDEAGLLALVRPIADGLDRAHRGGVLHRDIKPANILVDDTGRSVLIDFGSARFDSGQATSTKVTFYTPPYAAIEQYVKTFPQGPWTDIYALGVTLYECVTGQKPPEVLERLHGDQGEALSAREWPGFSPAFTRAVDAAMAIKPAERPQSIPEWLRLFDDDAWSFQAEESTRVAVLRAAEPEPAAVVDGAERVERASGQEEAGSETLIARRPSTAAKPPRALLIGGGVAALAAVGAAVAAATGVFGSKAPTVAPLAAPAPAEVVAAAGPSQQPAAALPASLAALADSARKAGRPQREVNALSTAGRKIADLVAKLDGLPAGSDATSIVDDINRLAVGAAKAEGTTLSREAAALVRGVQASPSWSGGQASLAPVRKSKSALDGAVAAIAKAADPAAAVAAAARALDAHQAFAAAFAAAQPALVASEQDSVRALQGQAKQAVAAVAERAAGQKPGVFASKARKDAYKAAQDAAALARTRMSEVDRVAQGALAASELSAVDAAVAQLTPMVRDLEAMKAAPVEPAQ